MFCSHCGASISNDAKFCSQCGTEVAGTTKSDDRDKDLSTYRWVPAGSMSELSSQPGFSASVDAAIEELPFVTYEPEQIPKSGELVPADCVWAWDLHPGPAKEERIFGDTITRFEDLGVLRGRTINEIVQFVGEPSMSGQGPSGEFAAVWQHGGGLFQKLWSLALEFDRYGVCVGVSSEINA